MGTIPLENAIRKESEKTIRAIRKKEAFEIERLEKAFAADTEGFKKKIDKETDARIGQELSRLENKDMLDRRKMRLRSVEGFINDMVDETIKVLRNTPGYKTLLFDAICDALDRIPGRAVVCLKKEDLAFEQEIMAAVRKAHRNPDVAFREDPAIRWGGCIIQDEQGGRLFNSTLERICFRKSAVIRHEIMKALLEK